VKTLSYVLISIFILLLIILFAESLMYLITIKNAKFISISTYIVMAVIAFITSQYIPNDYKEWTITIAAGSLILALVSLFFKNTDIN
jgi:membrane protein YdbS with pleckstrin-like domain